VGFALLILSLADRVVRLRPPLPEVVIRRLARTQKDAALDSAALTWLPRLLGARAQLGELELYLRLGRCEGDRPRRVDLSLLWTPLMPPLGETAGEGVKQSLEALVVIREGCEAVMGNQRSAEALAGHSRQSEVLRGNQRSSEAIGGPRW
jgi:hypothetical protein